MHPEIEFHGVDQLFDSGVLVVKKLAVLLDLLQSIVDQVEQLVLLGQLFLFVCLLLPVLLPGHLSFELLKFLAPCKLIDNWIAPLVCCHVQILHVRLLNKFREMSRIVILIMKVRLVLCIHHFDL